MDSENCAIVYSDKFDLHVFGTIWIEPESGKKLTNS